MATSDFGTGKTIFILAVVVGCFAILWPKIFYPMLQASLNVYSPPTNDDTEMCCDVVYESESDANLRILAELCNNVLIMEAQTRAKMKKHRSWKAREGTLELCREEIMLQCGIDINEALMDDRYHAKQYKAAFEGLRSLNVTKCLRIHFGFDEKVLKTLHKVRKRIPHLPIPQHMRQERPSHLHPEYMHPALREKGRAIPPHRTLDKHKRPGPVPGVRPPMGGPGQMVPPPKSSGTMGIIMPIYTIGIVIFFVYTIMKVLFKKSEEQDRTPKIKDFHMDPEHRRYVYPDEYTDGEVSYREFLRRKESLERKGRNRTEELEKAKIEQEKEEILVPVSTSEESVLSNLEKPDISVSEEPFTADSEMKRVEPAVRSSEVQGDQINQEDKEVELIFKDNLSQEQEAFGQDYQKYLATLQMTLGRAECDAKDLEIDQLRRRLEETERAMERIMAQMGSVSNKLSPSVMEQALTEAQLGKESADQQDIRPAEDHIEGPDKVAPTLEVRDITTIRPDDESDMPVEQSQQVEQLISKQDSSFQSKVLSDGNSCIPNIAETVEAFEFHREEEPEDELAILVDIADSEAQDMMTACDISEALDGIETEVFPEITDEEADYAGKEIHLPVTQIRGVGEQEIGGIISEFETEDKIKQEDSVGMLLVDVKKGPCISGEQEVEAKDVRKKVEIESEEGKQKQESPQQIEIQSEKGKEQEFQESYTAENLEGKRSLSRESSEAKSSHSCEGSETRRGKSRSGSSREGSDDSRIAVVGMEIVAGVEGGKKWSKDHSPTPDRKKISRSPTPTSLLKETELQHLPHSEDKRRGTPEILIKDKDISSVFLEALLPSETQLIVSEAHCQAEAVPLEELELDESEYDTAPVVLSGKMTLSVIGMEPVTDEQTDEGETLPKDSTTPHELPIPPLFAEGSDTPTVDNLISGDGQLPEQGAQDTAVSDISLETDICEVVENSIHMEAMPIKENKTQETETVDGCVRASSSTTTVQSSKAEASDEFFPVSARYIPPSKPDVADSLIQDHAREATGLSSKTEVEEIFGLAVEDATMLPPAGQPEDLTFQSTLDEDHKFDKLQTAMAETPPEHGPSEGSSDLIAFEQGTGSSRGSSLPSLKSESSEVDASCTDDSAAFTTVSATVGEETSTDFSAADTYCDTADKQQSQDLQQPVELPSDRVIAKGAKVIVSKERCYVQQVQVVPQTLACGQEQKSSVLRVSQSSSGESSNFEIVGGSNGDSSSFEQVNGSPLSLSPASPIAESELESGSDTVVSLQQTEESTAEKHQASKSVTEEEKEGSSVSMSGSSDSWMFFFM